MSTDNDLLVAIQLRAYFLWERAGRPDGGDITFWDEARRLVEQEGQGDTRPDDQAPGA